MIIRLFLRFIQEDLCWLFVCGQCQKKLYQMRFFSEQNKQWNTSRGQILYKVTVQTQMNEKGSTVSQWCSQPRPPWRMHKSSPPSMNWWIVIAAFRLLNVYCKQCKEMLTARRGQEAEGSVFSPAGGLSLSSWRIGPNRSLHEHHGPHLSSLQTLCVSSELTRNQHTQTQWTLLSVCTSIVISTLVYSLKRYWASQASRSLPSLDLPFQSFMLFYYCHLEDVLSNCRPVAGF